ncbi:MAG TPA: glutaredoxin 3 [Thermopetrobacter sp.]|nr:glutaredoxin 3 [Thermopetrobacter sp.]
MAEVIMYATQWCPYCQAARRLLKAKGVSFTEIDVNDDPRRRAEMMQKAGGRHTVPQIFINGLHVGGFDDLSALERRGRLDPLLAGQDA